MNSFSKFVNRWLALLHDVLWVPIALILAYWIRFNLSVIPNYYWEGIFQLLITTVVIQACSNMYFGLYRGLWRFASLPDILHIAKAVLVGSSVSFICMFLLNRLEAIPRSILILYPLFLFMGLSAPRFGYRLIKDRHLYLSQSKGNRALIIGAGRAGELLVREIMRGNEYLPVGFLDDAEEKVGRNIHGIRVLGGLKELENVLNSYQVKNVIVSIRNISASSMRDIVKTCSKMDVQCKTIPSLIEVDNDVVDISRLRNINIEDLLGREAIKLDEYSLRDFIEGQCVMVTGAGGSIGSELCRQTIALHPKKLILIEQNEFNLYSIESSLNGDEAANKHIIHPILCDIRDSRSLEESFIKYRPNIVLHAAAYKHVPIIENNVIEGIQTNIFGTMKLAKLAAKYNVEKFVMISTDKAVNPTSVMGATKRAAEIYCQMLNYQHMTKFITTRFGNVVDSTGSVVPLFREQIKKGGPVTVTHKDIERYFMSIPEAVSLILQAGSMGEGGEIFVLDMGKPIKIYDLARQMIRLSGYDPDHDIKIEIIGLRPGEKLYEELFHSSEEYIGTDHPKIMLADSRKVEWDVLMHLLDDMLVVSNERDTCKSLEVLKKIIPEYELAQRSKAKNSLDTSNRSTVH